MKKEYLEAYCKSMNLDELKERLITIKGLLTKEEINFVENYLIKHGVNLSARKEDNE